jgi:hypothetical protein
MKYGGHDALEFSSCDLLQKYFQTYIQLTYLSMSDSGLLESSLFSYTLFL